MVFIPANQNKKFRILIRSTEGTEISYYGARGGTTTTATGTFVNSSDTSESPSDIVGYINQMVKCTYLDDKNAIYGSGTGEVNNDYGNADDKFNAASNTWLEVVAVPETGTANRIVFRHTDTDDTADPFAKVKFFGSVVCNQLGLAEDTWYHGAGFNLSVNPEVESFFRGTVVADTLNVQGTSYFGPNARWRGEMTFDVSGSESQRQGMLIATGSGIFGKFIYEPFTSGSVCEVDVVRSRGDVIALYSSDERLKDDIQYILDPVAKVKQLKGVTFKWNDKQKYREPGSKDVGIIAQDLQKVYPELVETGSSGYLGVKYERLSGLLIEAVKEQANQIADLKSRLNYLESRQ